MLMQRKSVRILIKNIRIRVLNFWIVVYNINLTIW